MMNLKLKTKKTAVPVVIIFALAFTILQLAGCMGLNRDEGGSVNKEAGEVYEAQGESFEAASMDISEGMAEGESYEASSGNESLDKSAARKLITTYQLSIETKNYKETMEMIYQSVNDHGGYIESESESKDYTDKLQNSLKIRIPQNASNDWMTRSEDFGTITSKSKNIEDVSLEYIDLESRLNALKAEQEALEKLLKEAGSVSDIMEIRNNLSNVNYEIESYKSRLLYLDNEIDYDTINLEVREVVTETSQDTSLLGEIKSRFFNSVLGLLELARGLLVFLVGDSLYILVFVGFVLLVRHLVKKKRAVKKNVKELESKSETE